MNPNLEYFRDIASALFGMWLFSFACLLQARTKTDLRIILICVVGIVISSMVFGFLSGQYVSTVPVEDWLIPCCEVLF